MDQRIGTVETAGVPAREALNGGENTAGEEFASGVKISKFEIVRKALEAGHTKPKAICAWALEKYGVELNPIVCSSYKSRIIGQLQNPEDSNTESKEDKPRTKRAYRRRLSVNAEPQECSNGAEHTTSNGQSNGQTPTAIPYAQPAVSYGRVCENLSPSPVADGLTMSTTHALSGVRTLASLVKQYGEANVQAMFETLQMVGGGSHS